MDTGKLRLNDRSAPRLQDEVQKLLNESAEEWARTHHSAVEQMVREQIRAFVTHGVRAEDLELVEQERHAESLSTTTISYYVRIRPELSERYPGEEGAV